MQWEEQAYQISKRSNEIWKSHGGSKSVGNCKKIRNNVKNCCFPLLTFLLLRIYNNIKRMKNSAWFKEHACQVSVEYIENWQSYQGLKLYKKAFFLVMSLEKHVFS